MCTRTHREHVDRRRLRLPVHVLLCDALCLPCGLLTLPAAAAATTAAATAALLSRCGCRRGVGTCTAAAVAAATSASPTAVASPKRLLLPACARRCRCIFSR